MAMFDLFGLEIAAEKGNRAMSKIKTCAQCGLDRKAMTPQMKAFGGGAKKIMIVGDIPSIEDDKRGRPFASNAGAFLREILYELDIDLQDDCISVNAIRCHNEKKKPPSNAQIDICRRNVMNDIKKHNPAYIIVLGQTAWKSVIANRLPMGFTNNFSKWVGTCIPDQELKAMIITTYHPLYVMNTDDLSVKRKWKKDLKQVLENKNFYFDIEYKDKIEVIQEPLQAIKIIQELNSRDAIAFDYETTGLKPYRKGQKIISVSFSDGKKSWAFPFFSDSLLFMAEFKGLMINPKVKKIAHNFKFEYIWTKVIAGFEVNPVSWDTCIGAHVEHNARSSGLKFQSYIHFGIKGYDENISGYLKASSEERTKHGANAINTIEKAPMDKLLFYNGVDSLLTFWLYEKQIQNLSPRLKKGLRFFIKGAVALAKTTCEGVCIDESRMETEKKKVEKKVKLLEKELFENEYVKRWKNKKPFNYNSTVHLRKMFFDIMGLDPVGTTESGALSVDKATLEKLNNPLADTILKIRRWEKLLGTYIEKTQRETTYGKIHASFNLALVDSYRSSSSDPNFQNFPKRDKEVNGIIRGSIKPRKGNKLVEYDYKAMEVCVSACYNLDPKLIHYIENPDSDMHRDFGCQLFFKEKDELTKSERQLAKNGFTFPAFYGSYYKQMSPAIWDAMEKTTKQHLKANGITNYKRFEKHVERVESDLWNNRFKVYSAWKKRMYKLYDNTGFVSLKTGFRCQYPLRKNQITNYPIQGSAFHCLLKTFMELQDEMDKRGMNSKLVGQVHDSILVDVVPSEEMEIDWLIWYLGTQKIREDWKWLNVPLMIEKESSEINGSWAELKDCGELNFGKTENKNE